MSLLFFFFNLFILIGGYPGKSLLFFSLLICEMEGLVDKVSKVHNSIGILRLRMSSRSAALAPLPPPPIVPAGRDE